MTDTTDTEISEVPAYNADSSNLAISRDYLLRFDHKQSGAVAKMNTATRNILNEIGAIHTTFTCMADGSASTLQNILNARARARYCTALLGEVKSLFSLDTIDTSLRDVLDRAFSTAKTHLNNIENTAQSLLEYYKDDWSINYD